VRPPSEHEIQCYVVTQALRMGYLLHGDPLGLVRSSRLGAKAKVAGARKGWPDLCFVLDKEVVYVELKTARGVVSREQKAVHKEMQERGIRIYVVKAKDGEDAWKQIQILLGSPTGSR
jgi:VRR-NUC domain